MTRSFPAVLLTLLAVLPASAQDMPLSQVVIPGEGWKALPGKYSAITGSSDGTIFVADLTSKTVHRLNDAETTKSLGNFTASITSLGVAQDGTIYAAEPEKKRVVRFKADGSEETVASGQPFHFLAVSPTGAVYCTADNANDVYLVGSNGTAEIAATGLSAPTALFVTPDGGTVAVGVLEENHMWAFGIAAKTHKLTHKDRYYYPMRQVLRGDNDKLFTVPTGFTQDKDGRTYTSTAAGVQVFDPGARPCGLLLAAERTPANGVALGGPDGNALYALHGETLYSRKTKAHAIGGVEKAK